MCLRSIGSLGKQSLQVYLSVEYCGFSANTRCNPAILTPQCGRTFTPAHSTYLSKQLQRFAEHTRPFEIGLSGVNVLRESPLSQLNVVLSLYRLPSDFFKTFEADGAPHVSTSDSHVLANLAYRTHDCSSISVNISIPDNYGSYPSNLRHHLL